MLRLPLLLLFPVPLVLALLFIAPVFLDAKGFAALFAHPQVWGAMWLTLFTGCSATLLSLVFASLITAGNTRNLATQSGAMLAVPHLALAIGLGFFIVPTGVLARILAVPFAWTAPPQWIVTQDPYGLSLIAALVLKETPFLVYVFASLLNRDDLKLQLAGHMRVAQSLGHGTGSAWMRVLLPQLLPRMVWPLIAVFAYGMTVVDMALVIGPTQPPTLAQVIWTDLNDADPLSNARGAAGVLVLSGMIIVLLLVVGLLLRLSGPYRAGFYSGYPRTGKFGITILWQLWGAWKVFYGGLALLLLILSFAALWPFPRLLPDQWTDAVWMRILAAPKPLLSSLWLALATATTALAASLAWLETAPRAHDRFVLRACTIALCVPALLIAVGQYRLFLATGISGTAPALFLAHVLPVAAYVFVVLHGTYRGFDVRWLAVSAGLAQSRARFLCRIKWPLLKAPLLSAWAVGFAVSMAQYVPAQLAAAGRHSTLSMEAVTLASGGNRALLAAHALVLTALPLIAFLLSGWLGRPRWVR